MGRMLKIRNLAPLFALGVCGCAGSRVVVREYEHPQWGNVIHLANKEIEVILAPGRGGRLMHYSRLGESNLLWTARDTNAWRDDATDWTNWGGEKTWPWPHENWPVRMWPPPPEVEPPVFAVSEIRDLVIVYSFIPTRHPFGKDVALSTPKIERRFLFPENGTRLQIHARFLSEDEPFSVWSVAQIPMTGKITLERAEPRRLLLQLPGSDKALAMADDNTVDLANTPGGTKGMMDADGFRVLTTQGTLVLRHDDGYGCHTTSDYDDVYHAQIYKGDDNNGDAYVELEFAAPLSKLFSNTLGVSLSLE